MKDMLGKLGEIMLELVRFKENLQVLNVIHDLLVKLNSKNSEEFFKKLKLLLRDEVVKKVPDIRKLSLTPSVPAFPKMQSPDCLKMDGKVIVYRDPDLDRYLTGVPAIKEGKVSVFQLTKNEGTTFREMAQAILGIQGNDDTLKLQLKVKGHTFHLEQIRDLIHRTEKGENTGLLTNGYANLFFIEDDKGEVFVVYAYRRPGGWSVFVSMFGFDGWGAGLLVFARN